MLSINKSKLKPSQKIVFTLFVLFLFRFGNSIPLAGIDQEALKKAALQLQNQSAITQIINMYSGGGRKLIISPFSLGIIPYINASILIDLLTNIVPFLEKLQSEEGEDGKKRLTFYKKIVTIIFSIVQSAFLISYCFPYIYNTDFLNLSLLVSELTAGSILIVWISSLIDKKGIGSGTSIIIFTNIVVNMIGRSGSFPIGSYDPIIFLLELSIILILVALICLSQTARVNIKVVSARQLAFLKSANKNKQLRKPSRVEDKGLSIKLNQAGIFPIIIASNLLPFFSPIIGSKKLLETFAYYFLIILFNYFYTIVFWDPEKIAEQLRKSSVSLVNLTPGKETASYLESVVRSTSILGGVFLSLILFSYELFKENINGLLLSQINISSLIILIGVSYEIQKTIRSLYSSSFE